MDDDDELFGGIGLATVSRSSASQGIDREVERLWQLWADLTKRPDRQSQAREFTRTCREQLRNHVSLTELTNIIEGAARLEPRGRDAMDLKRVLSAMTSQNKARMALAALHEARPIVIFPRPEIVQRCSLSQLEKALGSVASQWLDIDHEAAGLLMAKYDFDEMEEIAERTSQSTGYSCVMPAEAIRHIKAPARQQTTVRQDRNTYASGRLESEMLADVNMAADPAARAMLKKGTDPKTVRAFHLQAPHGYWIAVLDALEDDLDLTPEEAYEHLMRTWNWHPSDRE